MHIDQFFEENILIILYTVFQKSISIIVYMILYSTKNVYTHYFNKNVINKSSKIEC